MKELFILFFCATIALLLGNGYYKSFRSGVLTIIKTGHTFRRDKEPIRYWIGMALGTFAILVMVGAAAVMAFLVCVSLSGTPR